MGAGVRPQHGDRRRRRVGLHGLEPALARHVDHVPDDGIATPAMAPGQTDAVAMPVPVLPPRFDWFIEIGQLVLADLQRGPVREQRRCGRPEVLVVRVHEGPVARGEVLRAGQARRQLQDRVAEVVGSRRRPVPRGDPDVAGSVNLGSGASHPHGPVVADRYRLVVTRRPAALGHRPDPAAVGRAVPVVAAVAEHHVSVAEVQAGALQNRRGRLTGGIHVLVQQGRARVHVQPDEHVGRRAPAQLVGDREDLAPGDVEHGRPGDADRRADVAARQIARGDRCPDVAGPQDGAGIGGQCIDRVVLGRDVHPPGGLERLPVDLPVEHRRGPRRGRRGEGDARRVDSGAERDRRGRRSTTWWRRRAPVAAPAAHRRAFRQWRAREDQDESATDRGEQGDAAAPRRLRGRPRRACVSTSMRAP